MRFVEVFWIDAWQDQENFTTLHGVKSTHEPMLVKTRGWLLVDDDMGISLANEDSQQDGHAVYRGRSFIPRVNVREVKDVVSRKARKPKIEKPVTIVEPVSNP
jgi:hypothetical protein